MANWTSYAKDQMLLIAAGLAPVPAGFYLALYSGSADPSGTPAELTLTGYARQLVSFVSPASNQIANLYDIIYGPLAAGAYQGVGLLDAATGGNLWSWADEASPITIPDSTQVTFAASGLTLTQTG